MSIAFQNQTTMSAKRNRPRIMVCFNKRKRTARVAMLEDVHPISKDLVLLLARHASGAFMLRRMSMVCRNWRAWLSGRDANAVWQHHGQKVCMRLGWPLELTMHVGGILAFGRHKQQHAPKWFRGANQAQMFRIISTLFYPWKISEFQTGILDKDRPAAFRKSRGLCETLVAVETPVVRLHVAVYVPMNAKTICCRYYRATQQYDMADVLHNYKRVLFDADAQGLYYMNQKVHNTTRGQRPNGSRVGLM